MKKTIDYRHGKISFLDTDIYIGMALERYGEREELEVEFVCKLLNPGDTVVDVGANIGAITIPAAQKVGRDGCVLAFEPQPEMFKLLEENIQQNHLPAKAFQSGLGSQPGRAGLPKPDINLMNNFGGAALLPGDDVDVVTLDSFDLPRCNFIKIDVEGMECEVIRGALQTIGKHRPFLYVENDRPQKSADLIKLIRSLDYELYWFVPPLFNPDNFKKNDENIFGATCTIMMICIPLDLTAEYHKRHVAPVITGLRRVTSVYDRENGATTAAGKVRAINGWAAVARFGGIGDNLMAASAIGALKRKGFKVEVITSTDCAWTVFEHNPNIDKLSVKSKSELPQGGLEWQKWFRGRADEFDVFAHLSHTCEGLLAFFPASSQFHWPAAVRRQIANKNYLEMVHDVAGCSYEFGPLFYASDAERKYALQTKAKVGERCIAICMSGSRADKLHPRLPGIVARILSEVRVPVVLIGAPERNFEQAKDIEKFVIATNGSSAGLHVAISSNPDAIGFRSIDWPIRRTCAFAQACDLVIGPDTGIMWSVAFEQMPKIVMLGHASPENITKHWIKTVTLVPEAHKVPCWPCHQLHDDATWCTPNAENSGAACISDISVELILATVKHVWNQITQPQAKENQDERRHRQAQL